MGIEICDVSVPGFWVGIDRKSDPENQPVNGKFYKGQKFVKNL